MRMVRCLFKEKRFVIFPYFYAEVKVSYLKLNGVKADEEKEDYIYCQLIKKPGWRPRKIVYNKIQGRKYNVSDITYKQIRSHV